MWFIVSETDIHLANFTASNIDEGILKTLSRDDLKDLFPGPENFLRRKKLWDVISPKVNVLHIRIANVIDVVRNAPCF